MVAAAEPALGPCPFCGHEHPETVLKCPKTDMVLSLEGRLLDDKFRFVRKLGRGGMASVWLALNVRVDRQVAIKLIRPEVVRHEDLVARFRSEAKAAGRIGHPAICEILDYGIGPVGPYIVMEHLQGQNLGQVLKRQGPLPVLRTLEIVRRAMVGLAAAHARGIVHRDLKPENIFLHRSAAGKRVVKLMDFGVAKFIDGSGEIETAHGALLGTPEYMAPEQFAGANQAETRTDIWALGAILYRALTGQHAFKGPTVAATLMLVTHHDPKPPRELRADLPARLEHVILRCLSKSAEDRFPTVEALDDELHDIAQELGATELDPPLRDALELQRDDVRPIVVGSPELEVVSSEAATPGGAPSSPDRGAQAEPEGSVSSSNSPAPTQLPTPPAAEPEPEPELPAASEKHGISASPLPRPDVELPDPELAPVPIQDVPSQAVTAPRAVVRSGRTITGWAIAGLVAAVGLGVFATRDDEPAPRAETDSGALGSSKPEPPSSPARSESPESPPEPESEVEAEPESEVDDVLIDDVPSTVTPEPEPIEIEAEVEEPTESVELDPPEPEPSTSSSPQERRHAAASEVPEPPAGTVQVGDYILLLEPGPRGDHGHARKYCEALGLTHKLGISNWALPNPTVANDIAADVQLPRGRYWTSARWQNRVKVLEVPRDRLISLSADRRHPRPLCVARWP